MCLHPCLHEHPCAWHVLVHVYVFVSVGGDCVHMITFLHLPLCVCVCVCVYMCACVHVHKCTYAFAYVCVCVFVCM